MQQEHKHEEETPPLMALNHVSRLCRNVDKSVDFYTKVLGFVKMERPTTLDFDGAWLFNYGIRVHLVRSNDEHKLLDTSELDPMDNHISFQCEDMEAMKERLKDMKVKYKKRNVEDEERGRRIEQLFFNDPDRFMIEIYNCENLQLVSAASLAKIKLPLDRHNPPLRLH